MSRGLIVMISFAVAMGSGAVWADLENEPTAVVMNRYVRYGFTVQNSSDQVISRADVCVCAPLKQAAGQKFTEVRASQPHEVIRDRLGNHILHFTFSNLPPYAVKLINIEADLCMGFAAGLEKPEEGEWLKAAPLVETDDREFREAAPLFGGESSLEKARNIYNWVRDQLRDGGYDPVDRGALMALRQRTGDCSEYAMLFTALCRLNNIPARAMGGYRVDGNTVLHPAAYHNWAEFYADDAWRMADPYGGLFNEKEEQYVATRIVGESDSPLGNFARFRCQGENLKIKMRD